MRNVSGMKKFTLCMAACIILGLGLTGCGGSSKKATTPTDTTAPTATSSLSTTAATNKTVTITVTASDNSSGVASITLPDKTVVTASTATYTVSANGTYSFILTDKAGNTATLPVTVSNIDTTAPTATSSLSTTATTSGPVTITVTASDNSSGVASITLPNSTVVTASAATYAVSANGTYSFVLTDKVGNTATVPVTVSNIAIQTSADAAIKGVTTTGFVDVDGAKVQYITIQYNQDLTGAAIDASTFEVWDYALGQAVEVGSNPGVVKNVYVDNELYDTDGKTGSGSYVVVQLNTDYQLGAVPTYQAAMAAGVKQIGVFTTAGGTTVTASPTTFSNYTVVQGVDHNGNVSYTNTANAGTFSITNITGFKLFANDTATVLGYTPVGAAFHATNCFDEVDGLLHDVDLPYALYVPADYDPSKKYMLVLHVEDAGALGNDPMITLTEAKANANYASPEVQQLAKDQGYAGLIVVAPQISQALRSTRDNYSLSAAVPATWQLVDYITAHYNIDADHIYASGQSMGGMQVVAMAAQRDNYFAAVWPIGSQWGSNNNLEVPFENGGPGQGPVPPTPFYPSTDATIWTVDAHGTPIDSVVQRNWYYMVSDDNILIDDCLGDAFSPTVWKEAATLYKDVTGGVIDIKGNRYISFSPFAPLDDQNAAVTNLKAQTDFSNPDFGMMWEAYNGGSHMVTWVYAHRIFANYQWLLSQSRQTEMARTKLDLNKPYVKAATQLQDADHLIFSGQNYYFPTAAAGSGTAGYNTGFYNPNGQVVRMPGWTPTNY